MAIEVSGDFGYVVLVVVATVFTDFWMAYKVILARKKYKVFYPTMYALDSENKEAKQFNCVQRGHQNFLEILPIFLALVILAGFQHPLVAAITGVLFLAARVLYFIDYSSGDPKKRARGARSGYAIVLVLVGCNISFAVHQILS